MAEFTFKVEKSIGFLAERDKKGFAKELTFISWNGAAPKYDIRGWDENHEKMTKGITLTAEELVKLRDVLNSIEV